MAREVLRRNTQAQEENPLIPQSTKFQDTSEPLASQPSTPEREARHPKHPSWHPFLSHSPSLSFHLDFNPIALHVALLEAYLRFCGLESRLIEIDSETRMHCWVPSDAATWHSQIWCGGRSKDMKRKGREAVLLLHGFGASAIWQWMHQVRALTSAGFAVYMPDLVFFGESRSTSAERSEVFQAECMAKMMSAAGVENYHVNGISYGGSVAYRLATLFPSKVLSLTLTNSGLMMTSAEYAEMLAHFGVKDSGELLLPKDPEGVQRLMDLAYHRPPRPPHWLLAKTLSVLFSDMVQEKRELLEHLSTTALEANHSLPPPTMDTLMIWGAHDKVFPVSIAERMKRAFGDAAQLAVLEESSHLSNAEQTMEYNATYLKFLLQRGSGSPQSLMECWRHCEPDWLVKVLHVKNHW